MNKNKNILEQRIEALELDKLIRYSFDEFSNSLDKEMSYSFITVDDAIKTAKNLAKIYIEQAAHSGYGLKKIPYHSPYTTTTTAVGSDSVSSSYDTNITSF